MRSAAALALLCSGCALVFTNAPEPGKQCNDSEATPIADGAFAALYGITMAIAIDDASGQGADDELVFAAVVLGGLTALHAYSAVKGFDNIGKCRKYNREVYEQEVATQQRAVARRSTPEAWQLTKQAAIAARGGDCDTAASLGEVVRGLDADFYRTVFIRDAAINRCMAMREIPIEPPSGPVTPEPAPVMPPVTPAPAPAPTP
jgi:hypothetical protein